MLICLLFSVYVFLCATSLGRLQYIVKFVLSNYSQFKLFLIISLLLLSMSLILLT